MKENFEFNSTSCSINDLNPGCVELWTLGQQVAVRRLCVKTPRSTDRLRGLGH
ncbi:hypothetical protein KPSA3_07249 [Pseudomonas syringae pv. actinidiae]|uniref:Uncharacterized protein n=1 Tax=Pseudomonas syringae pv. actinidiae TaxID=103796 RepID=A0AAN4QC35_PSESF|nr:hypothetical protein KPSA3_07249 [Pseudomonas syringae pv. actinidiae]